MVALPPCPRECGDPSPPNSTHAHLSRGRRTRRHPSCPRECGDPPTQLNPRPSLPWQTYTAPPLLSSRMRGPMADVHGPPNAGSTHAHLSRGRRTRRHPSCPRGCGDPPTQLNPRPSLPWQTYTAPPLLSSRMRGPIPTQLNPRPSLPWQTYTAPPLLSSRMRGPIPTQLNPRPSLPWQTSHGATPLVLAEAGTHPTQPTPISPVADVHGTTPLVLANAGTHPRIKRWPLANHPSLQPSFRRKPESIPGPKD